ncbi:MAG: 50S ribosomal protein L14e [Candidatus Thorarchaeota archaeon]
MTLYETGRVCVKTMGREAGSYCVVIQQMDGKFVMITGPKKINGVRRRSCNIRHLEPLDIKIDIKEGASDEDVLKALENSDLLERFRTKIQVNH